ncbi:Negative regulator of the PHO system [Orpheovirus IHUMI-LCC2]|uniref:Negative regulator of the PHO system n=1 Tax=Orpheovirus IHUMI-LCC2 TaxID=2023057 RepID=A0A2I2L501_9VIRU|nr:Negative regulator of the PHO system [Orpheovirus IHUMI-LCC2]SNW62604.1 Negative regulator of the PHO system [Orpheovirus IHUMI-LCC2]
MLEAIVIIIMDISKGKDISYYVNNDYVCVYSITINDKKYVVKKGQDVNKEGPILEKLIHPNIIKLEEYKMDEYILMEYMDQNLCEYIRIVGEMNPLLIKSYMWQLLRGLEYCRQNKVLHLDIKTSNLLIDKRGNLKIADFDISEIEVEGKELSTEVVTIMYRPPDILLGNTKYSYETDMWSAGCVFAEMLLGRLLFTTFTDKSQLLSIFSLLGLPNIEDYKYLKSLPLYDQLMNTERMVLDNRNNIGLKLMNVDILAYDLLIKMLKYNPKNRISISDALNHEYFQELKDLGYAH